MAKSCRFRPATRSATAAKDATKNAGTGDDALVEARMLTAAPYSGATGPPMTLVWGKLLIAPGTSAVAAALSLLNVLMTN
jgi:hypothetical protein